MRTRTLGTGHRHGSAGRRRTMPNEVRRPPTPIEVQHPPVRNQSQRPPVQDEVRHPPVRNGVRHRTAAPVAALAVAPLLASLLGSPASAAPAVPAMTGASATTRVPAGTAASPVGFVSKWAVAPRVPIPAGATNGILQDVTVLSPSDVWGVGTWWGGDGLHPLAAHFDGTGWTLAPVPQPAGTDGILAAVDGVAPDDVWAVGSTDPRDPAGGSSTPALSHYDGVTWTAVPGPATPDGSPGELAAVDLRTTDDGWAVGWVVPDGQVARPLILRWQAGRWVGTAVPKLGADSRLTAVASASANDAWAVGTRTEADGSTTALVLHWDGASWTPVPDAAAGAPGTTMLNSVAVTGTQVWAAGSRCASTGSCGSLVLRRSDGVWQVVPAAGGAEVNRIVPLSPADVWAIGYADTPTGGETGHVEHWDGTRFTVDTTVPGAAPSGTTNGHPASATPLAAAAADLVSGSLWAVGWTPGPSRFPWVVHRD